jgi:hypothetical protein
MHCLPGSEASRDAKHSIIDGLRNTIGPNISVSALLPLASQVINPFRLV